jgi:hypothetical protein
METPARPPAVSIVSGGLPVSGSVYLSVPRGSLAPRTEHARRVEWERLSVRSTVYPRRSPAHCIEYAHLVEWGQQRPGEEFDADVEEHVKWVYERAGKRAAQFGIQVVGLGVRGVLGFRVSGCRVKELWLSLEPYYPESQAQGHVGVCEVWLHLGAYHNLATLYRKNRAPSVQQVLVYPNCSWGPARTPLPMPNRACFRWSVVSLGHGARCARCARCAGRDAPADARSGEEHYSGHCVDQRDRRRRLHAGGLETGHDVQHRHEQLHDVRARACVGGDAWRVSV